MMQITMSSLRPDVYKKNVEVRVRLPATIPNVGVYDEYTGRIRGIYHVSSNYVLYIVEIDQLIPDWEYDCIVVSSNDMTLI